jgi:carbonic anhydrase
MTHYHDKDVRKALVEIAPEEKGRIEATNFGEITGSYVYPPVPGPS